MSDKPLEKKWEEQGIIRCKRCGHVHRLHDGPCGCAFVIDMAKPSEFCNCMVKGWQIREGIEPTPSETKTQEKCTDCGGTGICERADIDERSITEYWCPKCHPQSADRGPYKPWKNSTGEWFVIRDGEMKSWKCVDGDWAHEVSQSFNEYISGQASMQARVKELEEDDRFGTEQMNKLAEKIDALASDLAKSNERWEKLRKYCSGNSGEGWSYILQFMDKLEAQ